MILDQPANIETVMSPHSVGRGVGEGVTSLVRVHFRREEELITGIKRILGRQEEQQEHFPGFSFCSVFLLKGGQEHGEYNSWK